MNKKQLLRKIKDQKIGFVATGSNPQVAFDDVIRTAEQGGNVAAAIMMYHNTLIQALVDFDELPEAVDMPDEIPNE